MVKITLKHFFNETPDNFTNLDDLFFQVDPDV